MASCMTLKSMAFHDLQDAVRALRSRLSSAATALQQSELKADRLQASLAQQLPVRPSRQLQEAQAQLAVLEQRVEVQQYEMWKYDQSTSKAHVKKIQTLMVYSQSCPQRHHPEGSRTKMLLFRSVRRHAEGSQVAGGGIYAHKDCQSERDCCCWWYHS